MNKTNKLLVTALIGSIGISVFLFRQNSSLQQSSVNIPVAYAQTAETVPAGTVVAFDLSACPTGWSEFTAGRGRAIIGTNPTAGGGISVRTLGQTGGEETHTLTINEIPAHDHPAATGSQFVQVIFSGGGGSIYSLGANLGSWSLPVSPTTGSTGGGQAHNNMPPFIALLYCQKD